MQKARDAADQMLTRVADERLLMVPQMELLRKGLLEDALKFYQGFLQKHSADPAIRFEAAEAYRRMGRIHSQLGQQLQAEKNFGEALALLEKLVAEFPARPEYRHTLALTNDNLDATLLHLGREAEAVKSYQRAIDLMQKLVVEVPTQSWYREHLAMYQASLSEVL